MAIVDFRLQQMTYFDSMFARNDSFLEIVLDCLREEMMDKKGSEFRRLAPQAQLLNCSYFDVFALKFAEYALQDSQINFSQKDMPLPSTDDVRNPLVIDFTDRLGAVLVIRGASD